MKFTTSSLLLLCPDCDQACVVGGCRVHDAMVKVWQVKPHHQDPVTAGLARAEVTRSW
jgi:hypothetical protein